MGPCVSSHSKSEKRSYNQASKQIPSSQSCEGVKALMAFTVTIISTSFLQMHTKTNLVVLVFINSFVASAPSVCSHTWQTSSCKAVLLECAGPWPLTLNSIPEKSPTLPRILCPLHDQIQNPQLASFSYMGQDLDQYRVSFMVTTSCIC